MASRHGHEHESDARVASHASDAPTLNQRIEDMEHRLGIERAQLVANTRAYGAKVRRRLSSPTSIAFSVSMGFIGAEVLHERSVVKRAAARRGATKPQQKAAARSVIESITRPAISLFHIASAGILAKKAGDLPQQH